MSLPLLLLLLLVCSSRANQFLGTTITYYPKTPNADGSVMVDLRYKLNFQSCTDLSWQCLTGNCGNETLGMYNVSMDSAQDWCQTEGLSTRQVPSNAPFELWLNGSSWINNMNGITNWRAVTLVDLRTRSDTGQANTSPETTILPTVRVPSNCQRDFSLLAFDADGDNVQCRYGNTSLSECNPCTPPSVLSLSASCILSFSPTSSSNEGAYAVQLVMEDFPRQTITLTETNAVQTILTTSDAISKIPVQFVLWVDPAVPSCTAGLYLPQFLSPTPTNGAQLYATVNQALQINITAAANISTISDVVFSGPHSVIQTTSGPGEFMLTWMPSQSAVGQSYPICFVVKAFYNLTMYQSDLRCVIVSVRNNPTISTNSSATFAPNVTLPTANAITVDTNNITSIPSLPTNATSTPINTTTSIPLPSTPQPSSVTLSTNSSTTFAPNVTLPTTNETYPAISTNSSTTLTPNVTLPTTNETYPTPNVTLPTTNETYPTPNVTLPTTNAITVDTNNITFIPSLPTNATSTPINTTAIPLPNTLQPSSVTYPTTNTTTSALPPPPINTTTTTTTYTPLTSVTQPPSATYIVGLTVTVSSLVPLSSIDIPTTLQQVQSMLVYLGLPADVTIQIVSYV